MIYIKRNLSRWKEKAFSLPDSYKKNVNYRVSRNDGEFFGIEEHNDRTRANAQPICAHLLTLQHSNFWKNKV